MGEEVRYWGDTPEQEYYRLKGISLSSSFTSPSGLKLFTRWWLPSPSSHSPPRALLFMLHGYGNDTSWTFQETPIFLARHGSTDVVTDLDVKRELHATCKSTDKTLRIYDGMMHSLLFGETEENVEITRNDILAWLGQRYRRTPHVHTSVDQV